MKKLLIIGLLTCLSAVTVQASSLEVALNDDSAQVQAGLTLNEDTYGTSVLTGRFLYNDERSTKIGSLGFDFMGKPGNISGLEIGVGTQIYTGKTKNSLDLLALGIGTKIVFAPPILKGLGINGKLFYAPKILASLDAERLTEAGANLFYTVTPKVRLLLGYQLIRANFENTNSKNIDEGVRLGFEAQF